MLDRLFLIFTSAFVQFCLSPFLGRPSGELANLDPRCREHACRVTDSLCSLSASVVSRWRRCQVRNEIKATAKLASLGLVLSRPRLSRRRSSASKEIQFGRGQISEMVLSSREPVGRSLMVSRCSRHDTNEGGGAIPSREEAVKQTKKPNERPSLIMQGGGE